MSDDRPYAIFGVTVSNTMSFLAPVLKEMDERGWRTKVVCGPGNDPETLNRFPDVDVSLIPMSRAITPTADATALGNWIKLLRRERPAVVVGSTPKAALLSMTAARAARIPVRVFHVRGARWDGMPGRRASLLRSMDRVAAMSSTDVIAVSPSLADLMVERRITRRRPTVIHRGGSKGVDTQRFHPPAEHDHPPTLGFVGRLSEDKGIDDLLTVFEACRAENPEVILRIIGPVDEAQPISARTRERLEQPGVEWLGLRRDVPEQMRLFDVLVFPSLREGLPNVVIEAAATGIPTVGYDVTGVRDAVEHGVSGLLVPVGDVAGLAVAAQRLLGTDLSADMQRGAREVATQYFAQEHIVTGFVDHLEGLASRSGVL